MDIIFSLEQQGESPSKEAVIKNLNTKLYNVSNFKKSYEALMNIKLFEDDK